MSMKTGKLFYLCTVYTSYPGGDLDAAHVKAARILGGLLKRGQRVFCPIAHCHEASKRTGIPSNFDWWMEFDEGWIDVCDGLIVAMMKNWEVSKGITHEIKYAREKNMPIYYIDPDTLDVVKTENVEVTPKKKTKKTEVKEEGEE